MVNTLTAFDQLAASYDADFTYSRIGILQRERVWSLLQPRLDAAAHPLKILEINCGTGTDAFRLASLGHLVTATDASEMMISIAKKKAAASNHNNQPGFFVCGFNELADTFRNESFDLVFSNFGGLNCIDAPAMQQLSHDLSWLCKPGALLFFVVMGNCCINEILHFGWKGQLSNAFRRWKRAARFTVNGTTMPVYYYAPVSLKKIFSGNFRLLQKKPVGLFIPPSYLEEKFSKQPARLEKLNKKEYQFGHSAFSNLADHYCAVFQNKEGES